MRFKNVVNLAMAKYYHFQYIGISIFSLKNKIMQWISIEFLIIAIYYAHLMLLENPKKGPKVWSNVHSMSNKFPTAFLFFKIFMYNSVKERYGNIILSCIFWKNWYFLNEALSWKAKQKTDFFTLIFTKFWKKNFSEKMRRAFIT